MKNETLAMNVPSDPNLADYESLCRSFNWKDEQKFLDGLPGMKGLNIAYEAVERHANGKLRNTIARRYIQKNKNTKDFTYDDLHKLRSRFANVLTKQHSEKYIL